MLNIIELFLLNIKTKDAESVDMEENNFINYLKNRLGDNLPGRDAHTEMAPFIGKLPFRDFKPKPDAKKSAVLVIIADNNSGSFDILFTLRSRLLKSHSGQICFPGGRKENDETAIETALRETYEEIGLSGDYLTIIGRLSDLYVPPSNSLIAPVIAYVPKLPELKLSLDEVEAAFTADLTILSDEKSKKQSLEEISGTKVLVPYWDIYPGTKLWGATAMILNELVTIFNQYKIGTSYQKIM